MDMKPEVHGRQNTRVRKTEDTGARGAGRLSMKKGRLGDLYQSGCVKILLPRSDHGVPEAVVVNTAGGLTGGDQIEIDMEVDPFGELCITSQAAERIYRAGQGTVRICGRLDVGEGALMEWMPRETILYDGSGLDRSVEVSLCPASRFLSVDMMIFGREAFGERIKRIHLNDQRRVFRAGKLIFADGFRLQTGMLEKVCHSAAIGQNRAMASFFYTGSDAQLRISAVRDTVEKMNVQGAVSCWNNMIFARFLSENPQKLLTEMAGFLEWFRGRSLPQVWRV